MANPIKSVKNKLAVRTRAKRVFARRGSEYMVLESVVSLVFFTLAFLVFIPLLRRGSDFFKLLIVVYGFFVIVWALGAVYEYLVKSSRLLVNKKIENYSILSALNAILGLAFPLFVINSVSSIVVSTLGSMADWGTALCEIRFSFVRFYQSTNIYNQVESLVFWIVVLALGVLIVGGIFERSKK